MFLILTSIHFLFLGEEYAEIFTNIEKHIKWIANPTDNLSDQYDEDDIAQVTGVDAEVTEDDVTEVIEDAVAEI